MTSLDTTTMSSQESITQEQEYCTVIVVPSNAHVYLQEGTHNLTIVYTSNASISTQTTSPSTHPVICEDKSTQTENSMKQVADIIIDTVIEEEEFRIIMEDTNLTDAHCECQAQCCYCNKTSLHMTSPFCTRGINLSETCKTKDGDNTMSVDLLSELDRVKELQNHEHYNPNCIHCQTNEDNATIHLCNSLGYNADDWHNMTEYQRYANVTSQVTM